MKSWRVRLHHIGNGELCLRRHSCGGEKVLRLHLKDVGMGAGLANGDWDDKLKDCCGNTS